jgi:DNA-binding beta-propeller fold protein YncE
MRSRTIAATLVVAATTLALAATAHATGELTQTGCISQDTSKGACQDARWLAHPKAMAVSPDGRDIYAVIDDGVAALHHAGGALSQSADKTACVTVDGSGDLCAKGPGLNFTKDIALSPDGRNAYVAALAGGVTVFDRDPATGALTQKAGKAGCIAYTDSGGACAVGTAVKSPAAVVVSPDGANVYLASRASAAVAVFDRDPSTGALSQKAGKAGCIAEKGGTDCTDGHALFEVDGLAISPDGRNLYTTSSATSIEALAPELLGPGNVAILARDPATGALTQEGCLYDGDSEGECQRAGGLTGAYDVTISPDGSSVYIANPYSGTIARFDRNAAGALTQRPGIAAGRVTSVTVSPDGRNVYTAVPESSIVEILDRASDGALARRPDATGCVSDSGSAGACAHADGVFAAYDVALSPDGRRAYVSAYLGGAVAAFDRALAQPDPGPQPQGDRLAPTVSGFHVGRRIRFTLSEPASVRIVIRRHGARTRTLSLAGRAGANSKRLRLRKHGRYQATLVATDAAGNRSAPRRTRFRIRR